MNIKGRQRRSAKRPEPPVSNRKALPVLTRGIALAMIAIAVIASYFLTPLPVAAGITILAGIRLWIVWREERKDERQAASVQTASTGAIR
jgi:hypothetical protein